MILETHEVRRRFVSRGRRGVPLGAVLLATLLGPGRISARARGGDDPPPVFLGREETTLDALPETLAAGPRKALEQWSGFATRNGCRMHLSEDGRVLFLVRSKRTPKRELALVADTLKLFDETLPAPATTPPATGRAKPASAPRSASAAIGRDTSGEGIWTEDGPPPDTETAVLIQAADGRAYRDAVEQVAAIEPYLESWAATARNGSGFVLERPLVAAWQENAPGQEEWDPKNELVHRLMRLLVLRRASQQPTWLALGLAWYAEMELRDSIYCMPYRNGFVGVGEHTSWKSRLKRLARKDEAFTVGDLNRLRRGHYDGLSALYAWGTVRYLAAAGDGVLSAILEDFRALRDEKGILREGSRWQRIPDYEVSPEDQLAVLRARAGETIFADLQKAFAKGR